MKGSKVRQSFSGEATHKEEPPGTVKYFKAVQLRLIMEKREEVARRLVDLDYEIWVLEEFFRSGAP